MIHFWVSNVTRYNKISKASQPHRNLAMRVYNGSTKVTYPTEQGEGEFPALKTGRAWLFS